MLMLWPKDHSLRTTGLAQHHHIREEETRQRQDLPKISVLFSVAPSEWAEQASESKLQIYALNSFSPHRYVVFVNSHHHHQYYYPEMRSWEVKGRNSQWLAC